jgi:hypothetical protein
MTIILSNFQLTQLEIFLDSRSFESGSESNHLPLETAFVMIVEGFSNHDTC